MHREASQLGARHADAGDAMAGCRMLACKTQHDRSCVVPKDIVCFNCW